MSTPNLSSTEALIRDLVLNIRANHPVTVIYSDDPNETLALVKAASPVIRPRTDKIFYWSARNNWQDITSTEKSLAEQIAAPVQVVLTEPQKKTPLRFCFASPEELKSCRAPVFVISLLTASFKDEQIGILQELRDFDYLIRNGVNESYRIIILANASFNIPADYENIFGVIRHAPPSKEEIEKIYDEFFIRDFFVKTALTLYDGNEKEMEETFIGLKPYCVNTLNGLSGRQIKLILYKAVSNCSVKSGTVITAFNIELFKEFIYDKKFEELAKTEVITVLKPIPISEVGGMVELKSWLEEREWAFSEEASNLKVKSPKGMALIGPPGTGKTHVARATASLLNFPCLKFDASRVFNKYVGESENRIKSTLDLIEQMSPCVLFLDEIDKVFSGQAGGQAGDSGAASRVFGTLLSWMQDTKAKVFVVVTANRIQNIPSEFLRKGRLDEIWYVQFPTKSERKDILNIHLSHYDQTLSKLDKVIDATEEFSAAELEYVVGEAFLKASKKKQKFSQAHILSEVKNVVPSSVKFKEDIGYMKEWASLHARCASETEVADVLEKIQDI